VAFAAPDLESVVQRAFERVAELLDLPRRSDLEKLSERLEQVARALEAAAPESTNGAGAPRETEAAANDRKSQTGGA
jgi:formiminotetrahydrofolate cyclodeaminase